MAHRAAPPHPRRPQVPRARAATGPLDALDLRGIGWVILGGESGPGARPLHVDWVRSVRDQCVAAGVPFYFKQWGGVRRKETGRELDGRLWTEHPRRPGHCFEDVHAEG